MIQVENLHKSFNGTEVLKGISTTFEKGKTNLIIGQSGSGKTVFLKSLLGLFTPDSGDIIYDGVKYADMKRKERVALRQKITFGNFWRYAETGSYCSRYRKPTQLLVL